MSETIKCTYCGLDSGVTVRGWLQGEKLGGWAVGLSGGPEVSESRCDWAACQKCCDELEAKEWP
jgi:hypothetical protein